MVRYGLPAEQVPLGRPGKTVRFASYNVYSYRTAPIGETVFGLPLGLATVSNVFCRCLPW